MRLLALLFLLPALAQAVDLRISWSEVTAYVDDEDPTTLDTLPGSVTYEVWGGINNALPRLLTTASGPETLRTNVTAQNHCYYIVTVHQNPDGTTERSAPSATVCKDLRAPELPRPEPTPRISGVPRTPDSLVIEVVP